MLNITHNHPNKMKHRISHFLAFALTTFITTMSQSATIDVNLDLEKRGEPINPYIYGQFIEHLGRCIYGGIWAEMLEDRKFYFPITAEYDPYRGLEDTALPVVGASPWEILGSVGGVEMVKKDSFVGEHTPRITEGSGIRQHDLALEEGMGYTGYLWLKNDAFGGSEVRVSVAAAPGAEPILKETFLLSGGAYEKYPILFEAPADADAAVLSVEVRKGTAYIGTLSLMPADNVKGMRADTLALLKELDAPIYRWPGGNFVSGYNWRDGIGDRDRRPPRRNPAWTGIEHNDFGTDEFIAFCRLIGTEPAIAANTGFGDAYSAAQWVEYCNAGPETIGGNWRILNGNAEPFAVKVWCVGNEMWGPWQLGFMQLHHYVLKHNRFAEAMWAVDEDLKLIAVGAVDQINRGFDPQAAEANRLWSVGMLEDCAGHMDYISEHFYAGRTPWSDSEELPPVEHVKLLKEQIRRIAGEHRRLQPQIEQLNGRTMPIAMDEWNYWHRDYQYGELGCVYDLKDGLGTVVGLHEFYRHSDLIEIANYAQTVNVIGCIKTTKTDAGFATTGIALKLYRAEWQDVPLVLPDTFGDLDVAAAISPDARVLTISVVNPTDKSHTLDVSLKGAELPDRATSWTITGPDHRARNIPGEKPVVDAEEARNVDIRPGFTAPALSSILYRVEF